MNTLDIGFKLLRIFVRLIQRSNSSVPSPKEYYRPDLYIPLLENISKNFQSCFLNEDTKTKFYINAII